MRSIASRLELLEKQVLPPITFNRRENRRGFQIAKRLFDIYSDEGIQSGTKPLPTPIEEDDIQTMIELLSEKDEEEARVWDASLVMSNAETLYSYMSELHRCAIESYLAWYSHNRNSPECDMTEEDAHNMLYQYKQKHVRVTDELWQEVFQEIDTRWDTEEDIVAKAALATIVHEFYGVSLATCRAGGQSEA